jgi:hypothetical protein
LRLPLPLPLRRISASMPAFSKASIDRELLPDLLFDSSVPNGAAHARDAAVFRDLAY